MTEPEISRRCPECGASIRVRAFFCPQCGKAFVREAPRSTAVQDSADQQIQDTRGAARGTSMPAAGQQGPASEGPDHSFAGTDSSGAEHQSRVSAHRATAAARDVPEDNVLRRVERLRQVSSVVLDEAGYDPSLRFVLVAIVLFVLFLGLLLLSKWLG